MMRLIFFPAARLIDSVSSENAPRFPLSENKHTPVRLLGLIMGSWGHGAEERFMFSVLWVRSMRKCTYTPTHTHNVKYHKMKYSGFSFQCLSLATLCVYQVLQRSAQPASYDVRGGQSQEEDRKDVISARASLPVFPSLSCLFKFCQ